MDFERRELCLSVLFVPVAVLFFQADVAISLERSQIALEVGGHFIKGMSRDLLEVLKLFLIVLFFGW